MPKNIFSSATIIGILTTIAGTFGVPAIDPSATTLQLILQIVGTLLALWGRWRQGDLTLGKAPTSPPLFLVLGVLALSACGTCPPGTSENAANVEALVAENDATIPAEPASVAAAKRIRNAEAKALADKIAETCK